MSDYCSFFPDRLHIPGWIQYDISGLCKIHDDHYTIGYPKALADKEFYNGLCRAYPEYWRLWRIVYLAVKHFGWLFYWSSRLNLPRFVIAYGAHIIKVEVIEKLSQDTRWASGEIQIVNG